MEDGTTLSQHTQLIENTAWEKTLRKLEQVRQKRQEELRAKKETEAQELLAKKKKEDQKLREKEVGDLKKTFLSFAAEFFSVSENDILSNLGREELQETGKNLFASTRNMGWRRVVGFIGTWSLWPASVVLSGLALHIVFTIIVPGILGLIASSVISGELQYRYSSGSRYYRAYRRCLPYGNPSTFIAELAQPQKGTSKFGEFNK